MDTRIIVDGEGLTDVEVIIVPQGSTGREVIVEVAKKTGIEVEEAILFIEDRDEPLDLDLVIREDAAQKVHHVHRSRRIETLVHYQNGSKERAFSPSTRVQVVLDWAVGPEGFKIDPAIAPEMESRVTWPGRRAAEKTRTSGDIYVTRITSSLLT